MKLIPKKFPKYPALDATDVELLFTLMDLRARQPDDPAHLLTKARLTLREGLYELFDTLDNRISSALPPYVRLFGTLAGNGEACLVLNYDLLVERALRDAGRWHVDDGWSFQVKIERAIGGGTDRTTHAPSIPVLKLHGSHGWHERHDGTLGMESEVLRRLDITIHDAPGFAMDFYIDQPRAILEPSYLKPTDSPALRPIWREAARVLRRCDEWVVCGYSFPEADVGARTMFALAAAEPPLKRITIVDRDRRVATQVAHLIGSPVYYLESTAEAWLVDLSGDFGQARIVKPI